MADKVLAAYIAKYGSAPKVPNHLLKFSRSRPDLPALNYSSARQIIADTKLQQKYESIKHSTKKTKKSSSKSKPTTTKKYNITPKGHRTSPITKNKLENEPVVYVLDEKVDENSIQLSSSNRENKSIVIDNGTSLLKIGYVGDKKPISMFHPTQISNGRILNKNPISRGIVVDLYKIEDVYKHAFKNILCLSDDELSEYGIIMNCAVFNPRQTAEQLCELMMETFNVKQFFISSAAVLSLYAMQKVSGLVIESGGGVTQCVPIWKGVPVAQACKRSDVGGNDIDEYLFDLLNNKYTTISSQIDLKICKQLKEKYGYIAIDYRKESAKKIEYQLSDGNIIKIGDARFKCGELLLSYLNANSLDRQIFNSIMTCDVDIRKQLFNNIVISGGTMCISGFKNRLNNDLIQLCKASKIKKTQKYAKKINILADKSRHILSWKGGSIFGSLPGFSEMWYTKEEYLENGSALSTKIENSNIFFYDDYSPKEVDLKEIQNYNKTYRRRTISVYCHKNSITTIDPMYNNAYSGVSVGINNNITVEPWNDNENEDDNDNKDDHDGINGQVEIPSKKRRKHSKQSVNTELNARDEAIQSFLLQIEELTLENIELQKQIDKLKQENKFYKHNEKKIESEKHKLQNERLKLENLKNEIKLKSTQLQREISVIQQLFHNGNQRLQHLNLDFLGNHKNTNTIEPIND